MKYIKKIIFALLFAIALISVFMAKSKAETSKIGEINYIKREEKGFYSIQKWNGSEWIYVTYSKTSFTDKNGKNRAAYCINPDLKGVGWIDGEVSGYDVKIKEYISNEKLWRIYSNGYPFKAPIDMGVETPDDAYLVTKMAAYTILRGETSDYIRRSYRPGEDKVSGQKLEDIQRRGRKVIDSICRLVDLGNNGKETMHYNNILSISKSSNFEKDKINEKYYSAIFKINSEVDTKNCKLVQLNGFPEGTYIADNNGVNIKELKNNSFKLMVPKDKITQNINGEIKISADCKNYPIFYAENTKGNYQNYMLCYDMYSYDIETSSKININANKCGISIEKIDKESKIPLNGVKFSLKYEDGTDIGVFETNEKGKIEIKNLKPGKVIIKEIETNKGYVLNEKETKIELKYDEIQNLKFENEKKKGAIKIIKIDANNNEIKLQNVKFEIYDEKNNLISTVITDKNGEAFIEKLPIDTRYIIKEVETNKDYILSEEPITIELEENEIKTITFKNKKIEQPKEDKKEEILPRTGMVDFSNYLIGISIAGSIVNIGLLKKKEY